MINSHAQLLSDGCVKKNLMSENASVKMSFLYLVPLEVEISQCPEPLEHVQPQLHQVKLSEWYEKEFTRMCSVRFL